MCGKLERDQCNELDACQDIDAWLLDVQVSFSEISIFLGFFFNFDSYRSRTLGLKRRKMNGKLQAIEMDFHQHLASINKQKT